jgi:hypothetical protein
MDGGEQREAAGGSGFGREGGQAVFQEGDDGRHGLDYSRVTAPNGVVSTPTQGLS